MQLKVIGFSLLLLCLLARPTWLLAQAGALDSNFSPSLNEAADIYSIALQTNGQILIGGSFTSVDDLPRANIARLNADGSVDESFDPGAAADIGYVNSIAIQPDGKILIAGFFFSTLNLTPNYVARLNSNGSVDEDFGAPELFIDFPVNVVILQPDGKIIIGGNFEEVNRVSRRNIARLNADGTLDFDFDACVASTDGSGARALALQPDGKILACGRFTFSLGQTRNGIARLEECGDVDPTYAPEPGIDENSIVTALARRDDGKAVIGGNFQTYHGASRQGVAQLTASGEVDNGFTPGTGVNLGAGIYAMALQPDGKLLVGGDFTSYNGPSIFGVARLNLDGTLDGTFDPQDGPDNIVGAITVQADGKILVGGRFATFDGVTCNGLVRLNSDPARPQLSAPTVLGNGEVELTLHGEPGGIYSVLSSSNLVEWSTFTNFTASSTTTVITNFSEHPAQFYRATRSF